jgi:4-hydroxy-tetrahydrodipicolinate synthase
MISGAFTALVTPFDKSGGIDFAACARLLAWHESEGITGVVVGGTNGEGPSLSGPEKRDLIEFAVRNAGKLKVIAGLGSCAMTEAAWLCRQAEKSGAVASLALPPFYFRDASDQAMEAWFSHVLDASDLPCVLYNFPKFTGFTFSTALLDRLFERPTVVGIKDSSGDPALLDQFLAYSSNKAVLVGDERLILKSLSLGGAGAISGLANSFPRLVARQFAERTEEIQGLLDLACSKVKSHPQPAVHKFILSCKRLPGGAMRPPLEDLSEPAASAVRAFLEEFPY